MTITPTQADRDAAADLLDELSSLLDHVGIGQVADLIRDGEYDEHEATQAIAAHALAARDQALEEAAGIMDSPCFMTQIEEFIGMTKQEMSVRTCREGAAAIRAKKGGRDDG